MQYQIFHRLLLTVLLLANTALGWIQMRRAEPPAPGSRHCPENTVELLLSVCTQQHVCYGQAMALPLKTNSSSAFRNNN